ncbi:MAG: hypothetical protein ACRC0W_04840 [Cetobacterium sp.]
MIIFNIIDYSKGKVCSLNFKYETNNTFLISAPGKDAIVFDYMVIDAPEILSTILNDIFYENFYWKNVSLKLVDLFRAQDKDKTLIKIKELEKAINAYNKNLDLWLKEE